MSLAPGADFGSYRIIEQVGRGGMGTVYKAYQPALDRHVAIKVLPAFFAEDKDFLARFRREAVAIARLRHSNILAAFDYGEQDSLPFLVTELVEGGTLADRLGRPLPLDYTIRVIAAVASALDYAHQEAVLHRDLKPSNILLARDGRPVLSDFGLATIVGSLPRLTQTGALVGTPEYMAPEHGTGETVGPSADLYALAVVAHEMLTGRVPFEADTPLAVLLAHMHKPLPPPREVNPELGPEVESVLLRGLAKSPDDRYPTATAFVDALSEAVRETPTPAVGHPRWRPLAGLTGRTRTGSRPLRRSPTRLPRAQLVGGLVAALGILGLGILGLSRTDWAIPGASDGKSGGPKIPSCPTKISYGETISCGIDLVGRVQSYPFAATPGEPVRVRVVEEWGDLVAAARILDAGGATVCGPSISGEMDCRIEGPGPHAITLRDGASAGIGTGGFLLHLQRLSAPVGCQSISYGATGVAGTIEFSAQMHCFTFNGASEDQLRVTWARTSGDLVPSVQLIRPDGSPACGPAPAGELECRLDTSGQHTITLGDGPTPRSRTGAYSLDLTCLGGPCGPPTRAP